MDKKAYNVRFKDYVLNFNLHPHIVYHFVLEIRISDKLNDFCAMYIQIIKYIIERLGINFNWFYFYNKLRFDSVFKCTLTFIFNLYIYIIKV